MSELQELCLRKALLAAGAVENGEHGLLYKAEALDVIIFKLLEH